MPDSAPETTPPGSLLCGRRTRWQRVKRPASYWPCRYTREVPFWHPWHVGAAVARLRMRYLGWRGY